MKFLILFVCWTAAAQCTTASKSDNTNTSVNSLLPTRIQERRINPDTSQKHLLSDSNRDSTQKEEALLIPEPETAVQKVHKRTNELSKSFQKAITHLYELVKKYISTALIDRFNILATKMDLTRSLQYLTQARTIADNLRQMNHLGWQQAGSALFNYLSKAVL